jgi:hypothetical protein
MPKQVNEDRVLIFRCNDETILKIKAIAAFHGRSVSSQIRHMIEDYPLKPRFIRAAKEVLKEKPSARPREIIEKTLGVEPAIPEPHVDQPPVKRSQPAQWWNVPQTDDSPA